ncbi:pheST operon leader peptide PheM [Escherichia coli]
MNAAIYRFFFYFST